MQLLVSVRSAAEVKAALAGGADIIDAKEPDRGSLGAVDRQVLHEIVCHVPEHHSVSVALGDAACESEVLLAINGFDLQKRPSPTFLKLGFAGVSSRSQIHWLIHAAVAAAGSLVAAPSVVAVAYADWERAGTVRPEVIPELAIAAGAAGVLLDTHKKDGLGLLHWISTNELGAWVARSRSAGLVNALAGAIQSTDLPVVCETAPDVVGIRGAACSGGRWGRVSARRVRQFRRDLGRVWPGAGMAGIGTGWRNAGHRGDFSPSDKS